ncbi:uncharacterized protein METZ01_LOCUS280977, partial [marine metagenome]
ILAITVGVSRLLLPRLPEYQEEIKTWVSTAIGMNVEFKGMTARWRLSGPELYFFDASLDQNNGGPAFMVAEEVSMSVGLLRLIAERELVVDRVTIRDSSMDLRQNRNGEWLLQGIVLDTLLAGFELPDELSSDIVLVGGNIDLSYEHLSSGQLIPIKLRTITLTRNEDEFGIEADIDLPEDFGGRLEISANRPLRDTFDDLWKFYIEAESLNLTGWSSLQQFALPEVWSGAADIMLWFDLNSGTIDRASANLVISDLQTAGSNRVEPLGIQGSFEFSTEPVGWLLGANKFRLTTINGDWPQASIHVRVQEDEKGDMQGLSSTASYFNINDLPYLKEWLPAKWVSILDEYSPTGVMRNLSIELDALQSGLPDFDVSADLEQAGFSAVNEKPGIRDFSGRVRADRDGGRVEAVS